MNIEQLIFENQTPLPRRLAEAISSKLHYDYLCFKGHAMSEAHISHVFYDILSSCLGSEYQIIQNFPHPGLRTDDIGRNPEIDYAVTKNYDNNALLAFEVKWAESSHASQLNILWDLIRLKMIKDTSPQCSCYFILAGTAKSINKTFEKKLMKQDGNHLLNRTVPKAKVIDLHSTKPAFKACAKFLNKQRQKYPQATIPGNFQSNLTLSNRAISSDNRFNTYVWEIK